MLLTASLFTADIFSARTFVTLADLKLNLVAFFDRPVLYGGGVHEKIFSSIVGRDEAKTLCFIVKLDGTCFHDDVLLMLRLESNFERCETAMYSS